ncbi:MAG: hypothetical protein ACRDY7_03975 [Acidimicrobiia bacterium]
MLWLAAVALAALPTLPVGLDADPGVQPGGVVRSEAGLCTMNFLFRGSDGSRFIGTAGHCILGEDGDLPGMVEPEGDTERVWAEGSGPEASGAGGMRIGEFAYALHDRLRDFALVRLDPGVEAEAAMAHFGGPTGINDDLTQEPVVLQFYGQSPVGAAVPARTLLALNMPRPGQVYATGIAGPGDSGSGVLSEDGRAVGVLVTLGDHRARNPEGLPEAGIVGINRIGPPMRGAAAALRISLELVTADGETVS